jgi:3-hydroxybutyryl-CoA dehydrogenase
LTTVAIIGAGPLGRWLALAAARAGFRVLLEDVMPANLHHAQEYIRRQLGPENFASSLASSLTAPHGEITDLTESADLRDHPTFTEDTGFLEGANTSPALPSPNATGDLPVIGDSLTVEEVQTETIAGWPATDRDKELPIHFVSTIEDAVRDADLAIDCVPDELESKLEILFLLDRMAPPRTVLATPTTRLSIIDLASCTYRADKCVAIVAEARGLAENPASAILLRITPQTTPETIALVENFWQRLGFAPRFEADPSLNPA